MGRSFTPGVASKLASNILESAAAGALELSAVSEETETDLEMRDFLFFCRAFWMDAVSDGRLASWWKTLRFRMMAYTRLELPVRQIEEQTSSRFWCLLGWDGVDGLTIKLILDDVVEDLQEEEDQVMLLGGGEEEPGSGEGLQEVEQLGSRYHGQTLQVGRNCGAQKKKTKLGTAVP